MSNFLCIFASDLEVQMICHFTVGSIRGNAGERPRRNTTVKNTYSKVVMLIAFSKSTTAKKFTTLLFTYRKLGEVSQMKNMAHLFSRYNYSQLADGSYAPIDDTGHMPLAWLIGDTLASYMLSDSDTLQQVHVRLGTDYISVCRLRWRVSAFITPNAYSRRVSRILENER